MEKSDGNSTKKVRPTMKQKKYVRELENNKSMNQAALDAGYSPATSKNAGTNIMEKRGVQQLIAEAFPAEECLKEMSTSLRQIATRGHKDADRISASRAIADISGLKAADKLEVSAMKPDERADAFAQMAELMLQGRSPSTPREEPISKGTPYRVEVDP